MNTPFLNRDLFWHNPTAVRLIALLAVGLLVATVMLLRRRKSSGRAAAIICLLVSIGLHGVLLVYVPRLSMFFSGGGPSDEQDVQKGSSQVSVAVFDPNLTSVNTAAEENAGDLPTDESTPSLTPLVLARPIVELSEPAPVQQSEPEEESPASPVAESIRNLMPTSLASATLRTSSDPGRELDDALGEWLTETLAAPPEEPAVENPPQPLTEQVAANSASVDALAEDTDTAAAEKGLVPGEMDSDFAARQGAAKTEAIEATGGDASTEAAVAAALRYLTEHQRASGAWDPLSSGAGRERAPLGLQRGGAGKRAETGLTGLALLALLGAGNTHQSGEYTESVYRGLVYLLGRQRDDGSLAGDASLYAAHYCHAMASLSLAEAAVMTQDPAAIEATRRAIAYSKSTQHPITGGWRYTRGDTGDLSQLGWQALLIDGAQRAGALDDQESMQRGVERFLTTVRSGRAGGLASYRPGERTTPTMTAEALAVRLLLGEQVPEDAISEAEAVLLASLPGQQVGPDNYYFWYYASLALHQRQDDAWQTWNAAMKKRLLATQRSDGSWPDTSLWGGYGGTVYTTAMATLCLETYYRHELRQ